jgi:hypothetical protein
MHTCYIHITANRTPCNSGKFLHENSWSTLFAFTVSDSISILHFWCNECELREFDTTKCVTVPVRGAGLVSSWWWCTRAATAGTWLARTGAGMRMATRSGPRVTWPWIRPWFAPRPAKYDITWQVRYCHVSTNNKQFHYHTVFHHVTKPYKCHFNAYLKHSTYAVPRVCHHFFNICIHNNKK